MAPQKALPSALNLSIHNQSTSEVELWTRTFREVTTQHLSCSKKTSQIATQLLPMSSAQSARVLIFLSCELKSTPWNCPRRIMALLWVSISESRPQLLHQLLLPTNRSALNKWSCADLPAKKQAGTTTSSPSPSTIRKYTPPWGSPSSKSDQTASGTQNAI